MNPFEFFIDIILIFIIMIYLIFFFNQVYSIYKVKKRTNILNEYINLTDMVFDFYRKNNTSMSYYNEYKHFENIINRFIGNDDYKDINNYKKDILEIKELYKNIIPEIKKEYRQEKLKNILKL